MSTPEIPKDSVNTRYSLYDANDLYFNGGYAPEYMNSVYAYNNGIVTADNVAIFAFSGDSSGGYLSSTGMTDWQPGQEYNNTYTGMTEWNGNQNNYTGMKEWTGNQGNYRCAQMWQVYLTQTVSESFAQQGRIF